MAIIAGTGGGDVNVVQVNTVGGAKVVVRTPDCVSAMLGSMYTGTIPAALAANSVLAGIRNGPNSDRRIYITRITMQFVTITAATAAAAVAIEATRFSGANIQQVGTHATTCGLLDRTSEDVPYHWSTAISTFPLSACAIGGIHGGQMSVMTTTALTTTGATVDTLDAPIMFLNCTTTTPAILERVTAELSNELGFEHPVELGPGEGLLFRNNAAFPTGLTGVLLIRMHWLEQ